MADNNARDVMKSPGFSTWGSVGVPKENLVYDFLDRVKESTDAFFETISLIFDIVNSFLDFIASLLIDFTNPLKPILEEIIAIIEAFIQDLRNLGLYYTYDFHELKNPTEKLKGGYLAFEQRMVMKILNQSDPTRPDFTDKTKVFAMTFFAGADASHIKRIIAYMKKLLKFLTPGKDEPASAPINVEAVYYNDFIGEVEIPSSYKPDGIRLKWNLPPPTSTMPALPKSFVNPDWFIISVSTRKKHDHLSYVKKIPKSADDPTKSEDSHFTELFGFDYSELTKSYFWPLLESKNSATSLVKLSEDTEFDPVPKVPDGIGDGGSWVIYGEDVANFNQINKEKFSDIYKTFLFGGNPDSIIGDNDFSFDIPFDRLKVQNQLKDEYHITIHSFEIDSDDFDKLKVEKEKLSGLFRVGKQWEVMSANIISPDLTKSPRLLSAGTISKASETVTVVAPTDLKTKYIKAVRFFFLAYYLGRLDVKSNQELANIQPLTETEEKALGMYIGWNNKTYPANTALFISQVAHAKQVIKWVDRVMLMFKFNIPKDSLLVPHLSTLNKIDSFKYDLYEQLKSIANGKEDVALNGIYSSAREFKTWTGIDYTKYQEHPDNFSPTKEEYLNGNYAPVSEVKYDGYDNVADQPNPFPDKFRGEIFTNYKVYPDGGPVLYIPSGDLKYFGEFIYIKDFIKTYNLARPLVLLGAKAKETGQWKNIKPFKDTDLSSILGVLELVKKFLDGVLKTLQGIVEQILKYIHLLKTRIAQLQEIVRKIKALIDLVLSLRLPAGLYGTFHLADGTAGLVNSLTQAEDKPDIGVEGYGTGLMVVGGGVPSILIDLFIALMGGNSQEEE